MHQRRTDIPAYRLEIQALFALTVKFLAALVLLFVMDYILCHHFFMSHRLRLSVAGRAELKLGAQFLRKGARGLKVPVLHGSVQSIQVLLLVASHLLVHFIILQLVLNSTLFR